MGMIISVYRDADRVDCSANGLSRQFDRLCVVNVPGPFEPGPDLPAFELVKSDVFGKHEYRSVKLVPEGETRWTMFGGNYGSTSDSRWGKAIEDLIDIRFYGAVPIHDRIETREMQYMGGPK